MKASDKPEISKKWWKSEKPDDIKGVDLEKALGAAESALDVVEKKEDADTIKAALGALSNLSAAVDKTIKKECDKKKHKDLIIVLEKFDDLIDDETKELEKSQDSAEDGDGQEDEDEEARGVLKPEYLERMIKKLRSGEQLQFCFGLNRSAPEQSRLVLCNKRKAERLHKMLKQTGDFSNRLMTYGEAAGDGKLLQFTLSDDAKEPSQIVKLTKLYLKAHRELKFRKLRVIAGGQTFEEDMPDEAEGLGGAGAGDLQARQRSAASAGLTWRKARESISQQIAQIQKELNAFDDPTASSVNDGLSSFLDKYPDPDFNALVQSSDQASFSNGLEKTRQRLKEWQGLVGQGGALSTIDQNPFVRTNIVSTVNSAVSSINSELKLA